ncbi:putative peptidase M8, leishmanolysin [Plasmopara halstedii]
MKTTRNKDFFSIVIVILISLVKGCIHDTIEHQVIDSHQHYGDDHPFEVQRKLADDDFSNIEKYESTAAKDAFKPIRITPYYDKTTLDILSKQKRDVLYKIIPDAISRFQAALEVMPVQGNLMAQHTCETQWMTSPPICKTLLQNEKCLEMPIPNEHFGHTRFCTSCPREGCAGGNCAVSEAKGIANTDFVLYIRAATTNYCASRTLAYASSCQKDQYDRPTFGMANFCPSQISILPEDLESQVSTAMHEITHALGFSAQFFPYMRHPDGTPRTPRDSNGRPPIYKSGTCPNGSPIEYYIAPSTQTVQHSNERGHVVAKMVTPNVAAFVKSHFGCNSLVGAEIEQQDDSGCLGSHWEERIFEPEYMTPVNSFRNVFSALTLAFFEDSGWYRANTSTAGRMHFGRNRGCNFAMEKCINPDTGVSIALDHYCMSNSVESCSVDGISRSVCTVSTGRSIAKTYQYFTNSPTQGGDDFADFCPINVGHSSGDCSNPTNLMFPGSTKINILGESYCPNCKCTATTLRSVDSSNWIVNSRRQTGCYAMRCYDIGNGDVSKSIVELTIPRSNSNDVIRVNCTKKSEALSVAGFSGTITCPDPSVVCDSNGAYDFIDTTGMTGAGSGSVTMRSENAGSTSHRKPSWIILLLVLIFW